MVHSRPTTINRILGTIRPQVSQNQRRTKMELTTLPRPLARFQGKAAETIIDERERNK